MIRSPFILFALLLFAIVVQAQQTDRLSNIRYRLNALAVEVPGLNQKIEMDINDALISDFMRGLAQSYKLNINIAPDLQKKMTNHFSNIPVQEVLYFLAQQYQLDYDIMGAIINVRNYIDPKLNQPPPPKEIIATFNKQNRLLTLDLKNDTLISVARKITQLTDANVVVMLSASNRIVNGYVQGLSVPMALEQIAMTNRLKYTKTDDNAFILEALADDEDIVTRKKDNSNANYRIERQQKTGDGKPQGRVSVDALNVGNEKFLSVSAVNTPLKDLVRSISEEAEVAYFIYADLNGNITAEAKNLTYSELLQKILTGTPYSFIKHNGVYMIGEKNFEGVRNQQLVQLKHRSVDSLSYFLPEDMRKDVVIKEFKELNSFLVTGSQPQIDKIESLVRQIDIKVPMVTIEVIIMDVTKGRVTKGGLRAGISDSASYGETLLGGGLDFTIGSGSINQFIDKIGLNNVFNIGHVTPNFYIQLQAIENLDNVEMRQTRKLSTLNGRTGSRSVGGTRYC